MQLTFDYTPADYYLGQTHGIVSVNFLAPPSPTNQNPLGLRVLLELIFKNDLSVSVTGFTFYLANHNMPTNPDTMSVHPTNYAHFHNVTSSPSTFPGETLQLYDPKFNSAAFGPASSTNTPVADFISATGVVTSGATITGSPIVLHDEERPNTDNGFFLSFFINGTLTTPPPPDDYAANVTTTGSVSVGSSTTGTLRPPAILTGSALR